MLLAWSEDHARGEPSELSKAQPKKADAIPGLALKPLLKQLVISHDRIRGAEARVESARHTLESAYGGGGSWDGWYPRVDLNLEGGKENIHKARAAHQDDVTSKWRNQESISATQLLYDFGNTEGMIDYNRASLKEAESRLDQVRQDVIFQGVSAYLACIRALEVLHFAEESVRSIQQLSGMEEILVEKGAGLSYQDLQIKAQLAGSQALLVSSERALANSRNRFRSVYGFDIPRRNLKGLEPPIVPKTLIPATVDDAVYAALDKNPLITEAKHSVERLQSEVAAKDSYLYPKLQLVGEAKRREKDLGEDGVRLESKGTLQFSYNIFNGFQHVEALRASAENVREARKTLLDRRRLVEESVRNAWMDLMTLRRNAELYDAQAVLTEEFLKLLKKKRLLGEDVQLLDILVGERDYLAATTGGVTAAIDTIISSYRLLYQMGILEVDAVRQQ